MPATGSLPAHRAGAVAQLLADRLIDDLDIAEALLATLLLRAEACSITHLPIGTMSPVPRRSGCTGSTHYAELGAGPSQQTLDAGHRAGRAHPRGLIVQVQLRPARWRGAGAIGSAAVAARARYFGVEELHAVAALGLGLVHRHVGVAHQLGDVGAVVRVDCDAHAPGRRSRHAPRVSIPHPRDQPALDDVRHLVAVFHAVQHDDGLVASKPAHVSPVRAISVKTPRDPAQQPVADMVAERIG